MYTYNYIYTYILTYIYIHTCVDSFIKTETLTLFASLLTFGKKTLCNRRYAYAYFSILTLTFAKIFRAFPKKVRAFAIFCKSQNQNRAQNSSVERPSPLDFCRSRILTLAKVKTNRFVFLKPVILSELCFYKNINPQVSILFCWQIAVKIKSLSTQPICVFIKTRLQDYGRNPPLQARPSR